MKLFKFEKEQEVFDIGGIKIGGQPGEFPTVLIGTIFYEGHKIVEDERKGLFDKQKAEKLINTQEELSEKTGNPHMIDPLFLTSEAMKKYIDFVAEITDAPFLLDSTSEDVRIAAVKYASEIGLIDRVVYNSIAYTYTEEEFSAIAEAKLKAAIILSFNPDNTWPEGRMEFLKGSADNRGVLDLTKGSGIKKVLIDTAVLDVPSVALAARAIYLVKNELGLPAGLAPLNAVLEWERVKELGIYAKNVCSAGSISFSQVMGADFILYGPIKNSEIVFPVCAMTDAMIAYNARSHGIRPKVKEHPLRKIF